MAGQGIREGEEFWRRGKSGGEPETFCCKLFVTFPVMEIREDN